MRKGIHHEGETDEVIELRASLSVEWEVEEAEANGVLSDWDQ